MTTENLDENLFSILTDDCILELFERLSLSNLCLCSRTCKRLQALAENHFRRKFRNESNIEVEVGLGLDGNLHVSSSVPSNGIYVKHFGKFIKNVEISLWTQQDEVGDVEMTSVLNFIKTKCDRNLYRICVEGDIVLDPFCKKIRKFLRSVEIVAFKNRTQNGHDESTFLKYCPNLTKLIFENGIRSGNADAILQQKYRKLKDFYYINSYAEDLKTEKLKIFFQQNENIKTVAWRFSYNGDNARAVDCLQTVDYVVNLEHLFLLICRLLADSFDRICSYLNLLCERQHFQCLEIEFEGEEGATALKAHSNRMANLKQLTKIYLSRVRFTEVISALRSLLHLRIIVLTDLNFEKSWNDWFDLNDLVPVVDNTQNIELPLITEVHLIDMDDVDVYVFIMQFVRHWTNLKRILLPVSMYSDTKLDISMLNRARQKLKNACELTIFTNHPKNVTNFDHNLVKLKRVEFEFACNTKNATAFQRYYMLS